MNHATSLWVVVGLMAMQLLTAGCGGGGGGLFGLFEGSGDSGGTGGIGDLVSAGLGDVGGSGSGSGGIGDAIAPEVATVHQPEPASVVLFAGGLAGLAHLRRRKGKAQRTTRR